MAYKLARLIAIDCIVDHCRIYHFIMEVLVHINSFAKQVFVDFPYIGAKNIKAIAAIYELSLGFYRSPFRRLKNLTNLK